MSLDIVSINMNGLRSKRKQYHIKQFLDKTKLDFLCIQETFINTYFLSKKVEQFLNLQMNCYWSYGSENSKGVLIICKNSNIKIENFHADYEGRLVYIDFKYSNNSYRLVNIYAPTVSHERIEFLSKLSRFLNTSKHIILGGDFNFVMNMSLDKIGGNLEKGNIGSKQFSNICNKFKLIDTFRYLYPTVKKTTWQRQNIAVRLDRFYISHHLLNSLKSFQILPCTQSDHDFIMFSLQTNTETTFGNSYWKFNDTLLEDDIFVESLEYYIRIICKLQDFNLSKWDDIKTLIKEFCIDYSKHKRKDLFKDYKTLKKQYSACNTNNQNDIEKLESIKNELKIIEDKMTAGSIIRSKCNIINSNENANQYFFNLEQTRSNKKTIEKINFNNTEYKNTKDILHCFKQFYNNLYAEEPVDPSINNKFLENLPKISEDDNNFITKSISKQEILKALNDMKTNKSPGSDGLTCSFYKKFFNVIGEILVVMFQQCYKTGEMTNSQKLSYITLICKDSSNADDMKFYRPISLLNVDRKILSKILTNRLKMFFLK